MYQKERLDDILRIVRQNGYVTVKYLVSALHYSNATVNRDLNALEKQGLIRRSYGGVETLEPTGAVPLSFRYHKMKTEKLKIGKTAAERVKDGDVIFMDGSTTTEYMEQFLEGKKELTVITNNLLLASRLSETGIDVICLGGKITESPSMIYSTETAEYAEKYRADKLFFSTACLTENGEILGGGVVGLILRTMAKNAKETFFLCDHEKIGGKSRKSIEVMFDFSEMTEIISDYEFDDAIKKKYPKVLFTKV